MAAQADAQNWLRDRDYNNFSSEDAYERSIWLKWNSFLQDEITRDRSDDILDVKYERLSATVSPSRRRGNRGHAVTVEKHEGCRSFR